MLDVVIVGGSSAGLSAALVLGRSLREIVVIDDQKPCNRFSHASHGFLTRDGIQPSELLRIASEQLQHYPTVARKTATAQHIQKRDSDFEITASDGSKLQARMVLLATGLRDELPSLAGIEGLWGKSVFHCPYCDGYEVRGKAIAVYGEDETALHQVMMLRNWTDNLTLCTAGRWELTVAQRTRLARSGIEVVEQPIAALESADTQIQAIRFIDGTSLDCDAFFIRPKTTHRTTFAHDLGCTVDAHNVVQVDLRGRTSVEGVYAAGDLSSPMRSVAIAVAQGAAAGYGINADLIDRDFS
ncbi:MAG: NAD(P)/FAD-dependent oxidoreductase [Anaerolinea sp.]|nr:NAD(P)/FAD-dependent oxidoreductase [Anaerolinea sp.]MCC6975734.1 NAD(P)/FAD-dependent oxidoreductase [Anaerolineae bacterium]CAG1008403.1 thioredoxin reductase (NADPH) [Anaerolineae bacterium]